MDHNEIKLHDNQKREVIKFDVLIELHRFKKLFRSIKMNYINLYSTCVLEMGRHLKNERPVSGLPQPFKYFALDAMGHLGKLHSFLTPH